MTGTMFNIGTQGRKIVLHHVQKHPEPFSCFVQLSASPPCCEPKGATSSAAPAHLRQSSWRVDDLYQCKFGVTGGIWLSYIVLLFTALQQHPTSNVKPMDNSASEPRYKKPSLHRGDNRNKTLWLPFSHRNVGLEQWKIPPRVLSKPHGSV